MSLWQLCRCEVCSAKWSYDVRTKKPTKDNSVCEKCEKIEEDVLRKNYFDNKNKQSQQVKKGDLISIHYDNIVIESKVKSIKVKNGIIKLKLKNI